MAVLIAYASIEGQTEKIAHFVGEKARELGKRTSLFNTANETGDIDLTEFDKIVLAAPVHERRHPKTFEVFVASNNSAINERKSLFLSVSLSAAFPEGLGEAKDYADEAIMRMGLEPDAELLVAGAVRSSYYGYYEQQVLRHVVMRGRDYDPTQKEHEFTDWAAIERIVAAFLTT